jgi:two-component system, NarL family, captular synthesis response regulator RcsB
MTTRIAIADDHPAVIAGMRVALKNERDVHIVGTANNSTEIVNLLCENPCDVLVTDYVMPNGKYGDGLSFLSFLRRRFPDLKIVVFTMLSGESLVNAMTVLGIRQIVHKGEHIDCLLAAIRNVNAPRNLPARLPAPAADAQGVDQDILAKLSTREFEVFRLYVKGRSISEISAMLHRTKQTVSAQKMSAMHKLEIASGADLYLFAFEHGLLN